MKVADDRVAVRWPWLIRPLVQTVHYQYKDLSTFCQNRWIAPAKCNAEALPTPLMMRLSRRGTVDAQLEKRHVLMARLQFWTTRDRLKEVFPEGPTNCVITRVVARNLRTLCGEPFTADKTAERIRQMIVHFSSDHMLTLADHNPDRVHLAGCREALDCLVTLRKFVDDPRWRAAIFAPGRLEYGQAGRQTWGRLCWLIACAGAVALGLAGLIGRLFGLRPAGQARIASNPALALPAPPRRPERAAPVPPSPAAAGSSPRQCRRPSPQTANLPPLAPGGQPEGPA